MSENTCQATSHLDRKTRLADAAWSSQCHQPDRSARQQIDQVRRFWLAPKKARKNGR
jgi:hypothetical protein